MQTVDRVGRRIAGTMRWGALAVLILLIAACGPLSQGDEIETLETQNAQLQGTIDVIGTPAATIAALQQAATQGVLLENQLADARGTQLALQATMTVLELTGGLAGGPVATTPAPAAPAGDPAANAQAGGQPDLTTTPLSQPVQASTTRFTNTVMATDRDQFDCPLGITATFDSTVEAINVVTRISDLRAGSTISAVWRANGSLFHDEPNCWTPTEDWNEVCAYCSIVPDGPTFPTGSWTVELLLDDALMAQTTFQVIDPQAGDATGADSGDAMGSGASE